ncbi:hypothetical protein TNCV_3644971 [Trichonephila clavipes]|nr:hypothetical protein TNCV_3644971 [Trichonephila clavipes]
MVAIGDGPRNFQPWSSDEDDTWSWKPLQTTTSRQREDFEPRRDLSCINRSTHGVSSIALRFEPMTAKLPRSLYYWRKKGEVHIMTD